MSNHSLDRHFRQKLAGQSAEVPPALWGAIQQQIPGSPGGGSRSRMLWTALLALLVLLTSGMLFYFSQNDSLQYNAGQTVTPASEQTAQIGMPAQPQQTLPVQQALIATDRETTPKTVTPAISEISPNGASASPAQTGITDQTNKQSQPGAGSQTLNVKTKMPVTTAAVDLNPELETMQPANTGSRRTAFVPSLTTRDRDVLLEARRPVMATDCYSFGKRGLGHLEIDVYGGPSFATKSMTSRNENVRDYIMSRDTTEFMRLGFHIGARVAYHHASGFFARGGVQYTQLNERFDYENGSSMQTIITTDTIFDAMGNVVDVILDTVVTTGTRIKRTFNRFHFVDVPVLLGYQIENLDWAYGIQAGPVFNVAFAKKGDILAPNGVPGSFSDEQSSDFHPVFKDQLGLSIYGAVYAQKRIGESLYAFIEPHILHRLKSITLDAYPIDQRQTSMGLSLGIRLKL